MKQIIVTALLCLGMGHLVNAQLTRKTITSNKPAALDMRTINLSTLSIDQLRSGTYKSQPTYNKMAMLANMPNRYKPGIAINSSANQGTSKSGIRYYVSKNNISLPSNSNGTVAKSGQGQNNNFLICESSFVGFGKQFVSSLLGIPSSQSDEFNMVFPGALFRDEDIVNGRFIPVALPRRPSTLAINVTNAASVTESVSNFNDKNTVNQAKSSLLSRIGNSNANTDHFSASFEVKSATELALNMETSFNVDLEALLGLPISLGSNIGGGVSVSTEFNTAIAYMRNINYTLSVGGNSIAGGPQATIEGAIPPNVVCVGDVLYGNVSFIIVRNLSTRAEAKLVAEELLEVTQLGSGSRELSASAKLAFSTSAVSVLVYGGAGASTVNTVRNLDQLRAELAKGNNSVTGVNAMPLYYTLYYAADNAPAKVAAFTSFTNTTCYRASQLEVSLESFKPLAVVDFGDEELYGNIKIITDATSRTNNVDFWNVGASNPVVGKAGNQISGLSTSRLVFNVNPALVDADQSVITINMEIKDKIMPEEVLGASDVARRNGFVSYGPKKFSLDMREVQEAGPNGILKTYVVSEGNARIEAKLRFKLIR
jgi:hypothetical protein